MFYRAGVERVHCIKNTVLITLACAHFIISFVLLNLIRFMISGANLSWCQFVNLVPRVSKMKTDLIHLLPRIS